VSIHLIIYDEQVFAGRCYLIVGAFSSYANADAALTALLSDPKQQELLKSRFGYPGPEEMLWESNFCIVEYTLDQTIL
jgi:hypothetical protein